MSGSVGVCKVVAPQQLAWAGRSEITVYPDRVDGSRGTYRQAALAFADELTATGATATTWHDRAQCDVAADRDPVPPAILAVALGVMSSAAWSAIEKVLGRSPADQQVSVTIGRHPGSGGDQEEWIRVDGPAPAVADALARLRTD